MASITIDKLNKPSNLSYNRAKILADTLNADAEDDCTYALVFVAKNVYNVNVTDADGILLGAL